MLGLSIVIGASALVDVVLLLALLSNYTVDRIKEDGMKSKGDASIAQSTANEIQTKDYYYSAQSAQYWHEGNQFGTRKRMINKVNGTPYTERVSYGEKPTCRVTDAVLVASGV